MALMRSVDPIEHLNVEALVAEQVVGAWALLRLKPVFARIRGRPYCRGYEPAFCPGKAIPTRQSRETRLASSISLRASVPCGRNGNTT